jgi:ABC-type sugar transport system permease subunit
MECDVVYRTHDDGTFIGSCFSVLYSLWISFFDLKLRRPKSVPFVWFDNYLHVLRDPMFLDSVLRTVSFSVMAVLAIMVFATLIALLLNEEFAGKKFLSCYFVDTLGSTLCSEWTDVEVDL